MGDFFAFKRMITPIIIQILFWLGLVGCILGGLGSMLFGVLSLGQRDAGGGLVLIISGLLLALGGPFIVRIYCEIMIVLFRMNETLTDISQSLGKLNQTQTKS